VRVGAVDVGSAVKGVEAVADQGSFGDKDGGESVGAAAEGEDCVADCLAFVSGDDGVEAEGWSLLVLLNGEVKG
jgi:hypothetical protein